MKKVSRLLGRKWGEGRKKRYREAIRQRNSKTSIAPLEPPVGRKLADAIHALEHDLIKSALGEAGGRVTFAAQSLGVSYQTLGYMLKTRHKDLLTDRIPAQKRKRYGRQATYR